MDTSQIAELNRANAAQASRLAEIAIDNAAKLAQLNVNAAKAAFAEGVERTQALVGVNNVEQLYALRSGYAESDYQSAMDYSRSVYELSTQTRTACTEVVDEAIGGFTKSFAAWVEKATASAPQGSEAAVHAFKSSVAAANAAFSRSRQTSKQLASLAE